MKINISSIIRIKKKTPYWLAKSTGIDIKAISKIVNNETKGAKFVTLDKIAKALDVSIDELFDREDQSDEGSH